MNIRNSAIVDHGAPSVGIAPERFVVFAQNHDHIGNRPKGDRLVTLVTREQAQLAAALVLLAPGVPLLFMGEEYGDPAPFPYFIDHGDPALVEAVRVGRAEEFAAFAGTGGVLDADAQATFDAAASTPRCVTRVTIGAGGPCTVLSSGCDGRNPALGRSPRSAVRAFAASDVVTLVRSDPRGAVAALFNVSSGTSDGAPATAPRRAPADGCLLVQVARCTSP